MFGRPGIASHLVDPLAVQPNPGRNTEAKRIMKKADYGFVALRRLHGAENGEHCGIVALLHLASCCYA